MREFAKLQGCAQELLWWDVSFWAERLREARYDLNEEELRPYFALPSVLEGLFQVGISRSRYRHNLSERAARSTPRPLLVSCLVWLHWLPSFPSS